MAQRTEYGHLQAGDNDDDDDDDDQFLTSVARIITAKAVALRHSVTGLVQGIKLKPGAPLIPPCS